MRAMQVAAFGGPERLRRVVLPDPEPGAGECVIEVAACDVLFLDTMLRAGGAPEPMRPALPWVPGSGVAGRVRSVGAGVDPAWVGRPVGAHTGTHGGYAELARARARDVVAVPDGIDLTIAAALLHDGATVLALGEVTRIGSGDAVLVVGASGGLGIALVQLALHRGAHVVAVARGPKLERVAALGPVAVIDSDGADWPADARDALGPRGADVILDNVGGSLGEAALALLADGGRFSAHGTPSGRFTAADPARVLARDAVITGIETVQLDPEPMAELTARAFAAAAAGELSPVIGQTFALSDAASAHAAIESRHVFGKTLLLTDEA